MYRSLHHGPVGRSMLTLAMAVASASLLFACADENPVAPIPHAALPPPPRDRGRITPRDPADAEYLVILQDTVHDRDAFADSVARQMNVRLGWIYRHVFNGFTVHHISDSAVAQLRHRPGVVSVTRGTWSHLAATQTLPSSDLQWALDQIDQRGGARDFKFNYFFPGSGVDIYIVDSGIDTVNTEFTGRIGTGSTQLGADPNASPYVDLLNHGTMVAGLAAGTQMGVAKSATIHSIRVATTSDNFLDLDAVHGFEWAISDAAGKRAVINFSAVSSSAVADAMKTAIAKQIVVVVSGGNYAADACNYPTNQVQYAVVVGETNRANARDPQSNYGKCITVFAPGDSVESIGTNGTAMLGTGTSYAAPLVTGTVAGMLQDFAAKPQITQPAWAAYAHVIGSATTGKLSGIGTGSPNRLLNSLARYVDFSGPGGIVTDGDQSATWTAQPYGGDGTWTNYVWERRVLPGGSYVQVGTGQSYQETFPDHTQITIELRVTGTSFNAQTSDSLEVQVTAPKTCPTCVQ